MDLIERMCQIRIMISRGFFFSKEQKTQSEKERDRERKRTTQILC